MKAVAVKETTTLHNGVEMPLVGLGVMHMYGSECVRAICEAVDTGYRMIDTAAIYGNEGAVGRGIRECSVDREELFVTTKLWVQDASYERAKQACETSLQNMGLEHYDWTGKRMIPFCTNEGSGIGDSVRDIKKICKGADVDSGASFTGSHVSSSEAKIAEWAKSKL